MDMIGQYVEYLIQNSTPAKPLWNVEQIHDQSKAKWNYVDGCMIKAIIELYYISGDKAYLDFANEYIDYWVDDDGTVRGYQIEEYNIDNINEGKVLFDLYKLTKKEKYRKAIDYVFQQVKTHPRTKSNNFWHKKIYPNQIWLDGLYMVQPFYMEYEVTFTQGQHADDILSQFRNVYQFMHDAKTNLLFHGYDESREMFWSNKQTGCSPSFWLRSLGWYVMAIIDTIDKMTPATRKQAGFMEDMLREVLTALLNYQDKTTGMWYQVVDKPGAPGNYLETSGSAMIAYAMLKAARLGIVPSDFAAVGIRCFDGIKTKYLKVNKDSLELGGICLVAGLGGSNGKGSYAKRDGTYEYYISEPVVNNDAKGVAPFLLAYTEVLRTQQKAAK